MKVPLGVGFWFLPLFSLKYNLKILKQIKKLKVNKCKVVTTHNVN